MTTSINTAAAHDLHAILDGIAAEYSPPAARDAALTLRTAVVEGRIDGTTHIVGRNTPGCACACGHLVLSWGKQRATWLPLVAQVHFYRPGDANKSVHRGDWSLLISTSVGGLHMQREPARRVRRHIMGRAAESAVTP